MFHRIVNVFIVILIACVFLSDSMPLNCISVKDVGNINIDLDKNEYYEMPILCYYKLEDGEKTHRLDQMGIDSLENKLYRAHLSKNPKQPRFKRPSMPIRIGGMSYRVRNKSNRILELL